MGSSVREYKSPATISNMKNILALFGCFFTASCLPAPGIKLIQQCHGSKCHSRSAFGAGFDSSAADVAINQGCKGGKCDQDQAFGVDFPDDFDFFGSSSSDSDTWNIQNCEGSNCNQGNDFGRKKRAVVIGTDCEGSKCHSRSAFAAGFDTQAADIAIRQRCKGSKCDQDQAFGVDFSDDFSDDFFGSSSSDSDTWTFQNCEKGSNCQQKNKFGRKKRSVVIEQEYDGTQSQNNVVGDSTEIPVEQNTGGEEEMKTFVCAGGVVSSSCEGSVCVITCSDNTQYQHDCGSQTSKVSSTSGTEGSTVVTVSCGAKPFTYPACFPFCSDSEEQSPPSTTQQLDGNTVEAATILKSCIDACPVATTYRGCVTSCLNNRK